jgi:hypothetical protein
MHYSNYNRNQYALDNALDAVEYSTAVAGVMGVDTTSADITLTAGQTARLLFAPQSVKKPNNEMFKLIASVGCIALGEMTRNKRAASAANLIVMGVIDAMVKD